MIQEFRELVKLYRMLPRDMFVTQIIRDYSSSEPDLERIRSDYFEHLKKVSADFPYGSGAELKRRVYTRMGEPVPVKLAQDIHTIISVIEDGDCAALKPLLSATRARKSSLPLNNQRKSLSCTTTASSGMCACAIELKAVKETVSGLQADILLLKQTVHASDRLRKEQTMCTNSTVNDIRNDIITCKGSVMKHVSDTEYAMRGLTSSLVQRITELEDRIRLLECFIDNEEIVTIASLKHVHVEQKMEPTVSFQGYHNSKTGSTKSQSLSDSMLDLGIKQTHSDDHDKHCDVNMATSTRDRNEPSPASEKEIVGAPIPVRVTRRENGASTEGTGHDGFSPSRRKGTKHYCILGMNSTVNVGILTNVINRKGPTVTNIRVFHLRRDPGKVLIRLNVQADDKADMVMSEQFWPHYIQCRPWNSKRPLRSLRHKTDVPPRMRSSGRRYESEARHPYDVITDDYHDVFTVNRFQCFNSITDVD